jgi:hypothetical protein
MDVNSKFATKGYAECGKEGIYQLHSKKYKFDLLDNGKKKGVNNHSFY